MKGNVSPVGKTWHRAQAEFIVEAYLRVNGNRTQMAKETDLSIRTIRNWLSKTIPDHYPDLLEVMKIGGFRDDETVKHTSDGRKSAWTPERRRRQAELAENSKARFEVEVPAGVFPTNAERIRHMDFYGLARNESGKVKHGLGIGEDDDT